MALTSSFWLSVSTSRMGCREGAADQTGKTIIDATNVYYAAPEEFRGQPSSKVVAQVFTGGRLVKGFNHLVAAVFLTGDPGVDKGRRGRGFWRATMTAPHRRLGRAWRKNSVFHQSKSWRAPRRWTACKRAEEGQSVFKNPVKFD